MKRTALKRITLALLVVSLALLASLPALAAGTVRMSSTIGPIDAGIVPALVEAYKKSGTTVTFEAENPTTFTTGAIGHSGGAFASYAGIQTSSANTGIGSLNQAATSLAANASISFGAAP